MTVSDDDLRRLIGNLRHQADSANNLYSGSALGYVADELSAFLDEPDPVIPLPEGLDDDYYGAVYRALVRGGYDPEAAEDVADDLRTYARLRRADRGAS